MLRSVPIFLLLGFLAGCEEGPPPADVPGQGTIQKVCSEPSPIVLRRLNRVEYDNTVRDLLDDDSRPAREFPEDDLGEGFDNIATVLTVSPLHLERYEAAAQTLAESAVSVPSLAKEQLFEVEEIGADVGGRFRQNYWNMWTNGSLVVPITLLEAGVYEISVRAFEQRAGDEAALMGVVVDDGQPTMFEVSGTFAEPGWYRRRIWLDPGPHRIIISYLNDTYELAEGMQSDQDRNLILDKVSVDGPYGGVQPVDFVFEAETVGSDVGGAAGEFWNLWSNGQIVVDFNLPVQAEYDLRVRAYGQQAGEDPVHMAVAVDGVVAEQFEVVAMAAAPEWYVIRTSLSAGFHTVSVEFTNDYFAPDDPDPTQRDRNLLVDAIQVKGPYGVMDISEPPAPVLTRLMVCQPSDQEDRACALQIVESFARRAWRRPVTSEETGRLMQLVDLARSEGDSIHEGIRLAVRAILLSPHFIYRVEIGKEGDGPTRLREHELATRLAYFLWSSTPDDVLLARADDGSLSSPDVLAEQVERMLEDGRSEALIKNFGGQWLYIRAMDDVAPDYNHFPEFDEQLRVSMAVEARLFFHRFLRGNLSLPGLMDARTTYLNQRLADHYGVDLSDGVERDGLPPGFREFSLTGDDRVGLLGLGSVLTVTSFPTRTSPVKRGKWVLEQLMCDGPPPPPPGVEAELREVDAIAPLRERLEQHRDNPQCAGCHALMDPIGLGLEAFDGIGRFRTMDANQPIDASGVLPNGTPFDGVAELGDILKSDDRFMRCVERSLWTYALGRAPERTDSCALDELHERAAAVDFRFVDLIAEIVTSPSFTHLGTASGGSR